MLSKKSIELPAVFTPKFLRKLGLQQIKARRAYLGMRQGGHFSLKRGHGIEFDDYRKYEPGDDPRHIDYKLLARSDRTYIKRFREEQDLLIHIFIDTSASMFLPKEKFARAKEVALSIAYIASTQYDRVQLALPGLMLPKRYSGKSMIYQIAADLNKLELEPVDEYQRKLKAAIAAANFPGVGYFISDYLDELEGIKSVFTHLLGKNLDLKAVQILSAIERDPQLTDSLLVEDVETAEQVELQLDANSLLEYRTLLANHEGSLSKFCLKRGISWQSFDLETSLDQLMMELF